MQELLAQMVGAGCKAAAMEVSSHALAQERTRGLEWDVAVFTNLTQDHLDFHGTMENYFEAKAKLFTQLPEQQKKRKAVAVINIDDRYGAQLVDRLEKKPPLSLMEWARGQIFARRIIGWSLVEPPTSSMREGRFILCAFR